MKNSITQKMKFKQSVIKYSFKYSVSKAAENLMLVVEQYTDG